MSRVGGVMAIGLVGCGPKIDPGPVPVDQAAEPVRLVAVPAPDAPDLYLAAIVAAGSSWDPLGAEGTARLTASALVDAGAGERSADGVRDALFPTGNAFEVLVEREWTSIRLRCHRDDAARCTSLFLDALVRPRFDEADVLRLRDQQLQRLTDGLTADEERLAWELLEATLYEGHPYGHPPEGRAGVLPLLDAADLRAFHQTHYVREAMVVGVAGAVDDTVVQALVDGLAAVPAGRRPGQPGVSVGGPHPLMDPEPVRAPTLVVADTATPVTGFALGHPVALDRSHEDFVAMWVATTALGAHRQSFGRLFGTLRGDRGLNYGDYAYVEPYVERGGSSEADQGVLRAQNRFLVWVRPTAVADGPFALKLAVDEVRAWVEGGLQPDEFADVRAYLRASLPLLAADPGRRLLYALDAAATGTPNLLELGPALDALTVEQVNAAIPLHVDPGAFRVAAVSGEAEALVAALTGDAPTPRSAPPDASAPTVAERDARVQAIDLGIDAANAWVIPAEAAFR